MAENTYQRTMRVYTEDTSIPDAEVDKFWTLYPNEQREVLANYLLNVKKGQLKDAGQVEQLDADVSDLMDESELLRSNKARNRIQAFKDKTGKSQLSDVEFENFMNNPESDNYPDEKKSWLSDTLETKNGKETYANRLHNMNRYDNSSYDDKEVKSTPQRTVGNPQAWQNAGEKVGRVLGLPYAGTEAEAAAEGISNPYEQHPFRSLGKDVASTIPFLLSPVKAVSVPVKIAKGAGLGAGFGTKDATLGTEAEDEQHNPYLYSDKIKQIAKDVGLGVLFSSGADGIKSGIRGAKNFLFKSPELKGDADRALNAAINHTSAATKDRYEKYATKYANNPEYISAPDKKAFLDKKINEDMEATARTFDARDYGRELDDQARKNNNFIDDIPFLQEHFEIPNDLKKFPIYNYKKNAPYYLTAENQDAALNIGKKVLKKSADKILPGASKVPYYLSKDNDDDELTK